MSITLRPATPGFGLEAQGIDVSQPLTAEQVAILQQAWLDADGILFFRNQNLTPEQHIAFSGVFGNVYSEGAKNNPALAHYYLEGHPEIYQVSNKQIDGKPVGREDAGTFWHSDASWHAAPPTGSLLLARELPTVGGDTMFANMYRAYETLSEPMKQMLSGLEASHSILTAALQTSYAKEYVGKLDQASQKQAVHPLIKVHPDSGRKVLFVNPGFTSHIIGIPTAESRAILDFLFEHSTQPDNVYRHVWQLNDLLMWDNRCVMHYAVPNYKAHGIRYMHRTTIKAPEVAGAL
ncbi:TauD/TfdA family dioxygenase [Paenalcaligenes niemegkensis]|uniref:TauD/TfdA dioxygenase family protein n=1 Tax=Paenalcaligenes niemegkensis TaxID=2895469 RepID=UPI001EE971ED|nr:TauD/TfdA family dioxygenase [Paenalcaligenes niemegkensis]MCQ9618240.1 TauD/TfdA family dioxygenase [Paenalcaligenes niemegkensis]